MLQGASGGMMMVRRIALTVTAIALGALTLPGCPARQAAAQRAQAMAIAERDALEAQQAQAKAAAAQKEGKSGTADERGKKAAEQDIAAGVLRLKEYPPLPAPAWHGKFINLLKTECGVEWLVVQGPADSKDLRDEVNAYNAVMRAEIERRFEPGIIEKLQKQAQEK
jgi:hypothetical protein